MSRGAATVTVLSPAKQQRMRALYASGEYLQSELAEAFRVSQSTVSTVLRGVVRPILPGITVKHEPKGPPLPAGHTPKPVLWLSERQGGWWPNVSRRCADCGGRLFLVPPLMLADGALSCLSCSREPYEVVAR